MFADVVEGLNEHVLHCACGLPGNLQSLRHVHHELNVHLSLAAKTGY